MLLHLWGSDSLFRQVVHLQRYKNGYKAPEQGRCLVSIQKVVQEPVNQIGNKSQYTAQHYLPYSGIVQAVVYPETGNQRHDDYEQES